MGVIVNGGWQPDVGEWVAMVSFFLNVGFSLGPIPFRQMHIIDLHRAPCHHHLIQGKTIVARPLPILGSIDESFPHWVQLHIIEPLAKLLRAAHAEIL